MWTCTGTRELEYHLQVPAETEDRLKLDAEEHGTVISTVGSQRLLFDQFQAGGPQFHS